MADNAEDWYWFIGGNQTQVYSSARQGYFPVSDTIYQSWLSSAPTHITAELTTEDDLFTLLAEKAPLLAPASYRVDIEFAKTDKNILLFNVLFDMANQIRALQGNTAITKAQFKTYLQSKLP